MGLLQVFKPGEGLIEVLGQVEHALGDVYYLVLARSGHSDQTRYGVGGDQLGLAQLLADLEGHIESTHGLQRGTSPLDIVVVKGHFGQVERHLLN